MSARRSGERPLRVEIGHLVVRGGLTAAGAAGASRPDAPPAESLVAPLAAALGRHLDGELAARAAAAVAGAVAAAGTGRGGGDGRA